MARSGRVRIIHKIMQMLYIRIPGRTSTQLHPHELDTAEYDGGLSCEYAVRWSI